MKVLITGGYGFIGAFVAERFYKEGYEVSIIDNSSFQDRRRVSFKHKSYILSVEDGKCEEIFRNARFDTVVHLAAQVNVAASMENPRMDTRSNVLGLTNMLSLARKYGVQKFIFASSSAVYGANRQLPYTESSLCEPVSTFGLNKWIGETYCRKWQEMHGLETLCFRISDVYGPRAGGTGDEDVVSVYMKRAMEGKELPVYGDGEQTRDFIYVEDVADAIYRASYSSLTGIYNLSANTETSLNEVLDVLRRLHGPVNAVRKEGRYDDVRRSKLDNTRIMTDLDWAPKYSFEEGMSKTYEWYRNESLPEAASLKTDERKPSVIARVVKALVPYAENALAFALIAWATIALEDKMYDFIDFKLIYIIILGIVYGSRQSIVAVALSALLHVYQEMQNGRDLVSLMNDTNFFFQLAVYLFIGLVVGYSVERRKRTIASRESQLESLAEKHSFLNDVYNETRLVKEELQQQIMNNGDSFGKIYSVTKQLEGLEPEKILTSTVSVVESIMKTESVAIYTVNKYGSYLRLAARSSGNGFEAPNSMKVEDFPYIRQLLQDKKLFVNKELRGDLPLISAPVLSGGEVVAVISLQGMNFEHFTLYYQNLFKVLTDLISSALSRAFSYVEASGSQRYIEGTPILKPDVFESIIASKRSAKTKHGIDYVLLTAGSAMDAGADLPQQIARLLRETDYIGMTAQGDLMVLLSNSGLADVSFVLERFTNNGISLRIVEEDLRYA